MLAQIARVRTGKLAKSTLEALLTQMYAILMRLDLRRRSGRDVAEAALVRLDLLVRLQVVVHGLLGAEALAAARPRAHVRPIASVRLDVTCELAALLEVAIVAAAVPLAFEFAFHELHVRVADMVLEGFGGGRGVITDVRGAGDDPFAGKRGAIIGARFGFDHRAC